MFSGNGTAKGIGVTTTGKSLIIPRPAGVIYCSVERHVTVAFYNNMVG
jgi:hypothetical protein